MLGIWRMLFLIWEGWRDDPDAWRPSTWDQRVPPC